MTRLCVLGNSHVASLKLGWNDIRDEFPDVSIRFFAAPGAGLKDLVVEGSQLVPAQAKLKEILAVTSEGDPVINSSDYDAFLTYGMAFDMGPVDQRLSEAVFNTYCRERAVRNNNFRLVKKLASITDRPIFMGHVPLHADIGNVTPAPWIAYNDLHATIAKVLLKRRVTLLRQPESTISQNIRTRAQFTKGSVRLKVNESAAPAKQHPEEDIRHMNGEFGAIYLREAISTIVAAARHSHASAA